MCGGVHADGDGVGWCGLTFVRNAVGFKPTDWADDMTWLR